MLGSGDDAAISERTGRTATSVDTLVEGVHFRIPPFSHEDVGHKALATALSDLAAMGATPREAYVQLGLPDGHEEGALRLADGLGALAAQHGVVVAGGDVTRWAELVCAIPVVGEIVAGDAVRRTGAAPGQALAITGELGGAAAGLRVLDGPGLAAALDSGVADALRSRQLRPRPQVAAGRLLAELGATAMIDLSDGLAGDARHLARASSVALEVDVDLVPVQEGVAEVAAAAGEDAALALGGGEDYELLVALPREGLDRMIAALAEIGVRLTEAGRVREAPAGEEDVILRRADGARVEASGYDQLRRRRARRKPS